jgi:hypothetical protein
MLDFPKLDAMASDLDLMVLAATREQDLAA